MLRSLPHCGKVRRRQRSGGGAVEVGSGMGGGGAVRSGGVVGGHAVAWWPGRTLAPAVAVGGERMTVGKKLGIAGVKQYLM
ncbi:unnamed protein product [Sphenostylis stenocarpa]|uniref:Uncharacterized protein n=1 Tax=Sphenostylis stenocarpa TaxID=92480 RepID=A0AA86SUU4_9FABA|nr:unnamed protein product [Sphenostylis stenocarpa]